MTFRNDSDDETSVLSKNEIHNPDPAEPLYQTGDETGVEMQLGLKSLTPEEIRQMLRELHSQKIEIETHNEALRRAQVELDAARARYFDLYDMAPVGYCTVSEKGTILEANLTACNMLGIPRGSLVMQPLAKFILKEDQDVFYLHLKKLLETTEPQAFELRMLKNDSTIFWASLKGVPAKDNDGARVFRFAMSDITERKQIEEALHQSQKIESIGRLAGGVAHDLNNMLQVVLGHTELALEQTDPAQPLYARLGKIREAAERSAVVTRQLLTFARKQIISPKVLDLNDTIADMIAMLKHLIGENIELIWIRGDTPLPVKVDPSQIDQVLANLCINAREAIKGAGKITIRTAASAFDQAYCDKNPRYAPGEYALISVNDNGSGMEKEMLDNLFEPFFSTKDASKGAGLGLAAVYGIIKQNNGFIDVSSEIGQGTTFNLYLPGHKNKTVQDIKKGPTERRHGNETILLVEDEQAILDMTAVMLEQLGYTVLQTSSPEEAIHLAETNAGAIQLLLTDVIMPVINGRDLAEKLQSRYPDLKILFMSGYTADVIAGQGVLDKGVHFLQKPFSLKDLADKLRLTLDSDGI